MDGVRPRALSSRSIYLACLAGILSTALFPPAGMWFLAPVAITPLLAAVHKQKWQAAFRTGWIYGLVYFALLVWWLAPTISRFGDLPIWAACPVIGLLVCYLALFPAAWCGLAAKAGRQDRTGLPLAVTLSLLWGGLEWLRGWMLSGFPWGSLAYCLSPQPLLFQIAEITGPYAISSVLVFLNLIIFNTTINFKKGRQEAAKIIIHISTALVLCSAILIYGALRYKEVSANDREFPRVGAAAIQGSLAQELKWEPGLQHHTVELYKKLTLEAVKSLEHGGEERIIIWPETALPFFFQDDGILSRMVREVAIDSKSPIIFGTPAYQVTADGHDPVYFNRACLIGPDGKSLGCYDKRHLVPFGEYLPWGPLTSWARSLVPAAGNFSAGRSAAPLVYGPIKTGVLICFESIFPEIARQSVLEGANLLAVITNDSWFGDTGAPWQHAQMAAFRAVETRRWLVRAANTGVSEIIAPTGQVVAKSSLFRQDIVTGYPHLRHDLTVYSRTGDMPFLIVVVLAVVGRYIQTRKDRIYSMR